VAYWLAQFASDEESLLAEQDDAQVPAEVPAPADADNAPETPRPVEHPFPPEYLQELERLLDE
jgi:hypothetical protein